MSQAINHQTNIIFPAPSQVIRFSGFFFLDCSFVYYCLRWRSSMVHLPRWLFTSQITSRSPLIFSTGAGVPRVEKIWRESVPSLHPFLGSSQCDINVVVIIRSNVCSAANTYFLSFFFPFFFPFLLLLSGAADDSMLYLLILLALGFVMVTFDIGDMHKILFSFSVNECGTPAVRPN